MIITEEWNEMNSEWHSNEPPSKASLPFCLFLKTMALFLTASKQINNYKQKSGA